MYARTSRMNRAARLAAALFLILACIARPTVAKHRFHAVKPRQGAQPISGPLTCVKQKDQALCNDTTGCTW
jgi:hypothetical protein